MRDFCAYGGVRWSLLRGVGNTASSPLPRSGWESFLFFKSFRIFFSPLTDRFSTALP